jgi:hypothetical protein
VSAPNQIRGPPSNQQTVDISTIYNQTMADRLEFLQGTLDMLILRTLAQAPLHGYAIARAIRQATDDAIQVEAGSLYPAVQRLEMQGLLAAKMGSFPIATAACALIGSRRPAESVSTPKFHAGKSSSERPTGAHRRDRL